MILSPLDPTVKKSQTQALTNEYKGHVFEYLVAHTLARHYGVEKDFLESFGGELKQRLSFYEAWLRENQREMLPRLQVMARESAQTLIAKTSLSAEKISSVMVMGKTAQSSRYRDFAEADLLLISSREQMIPISVKLCGQGAFVNSKSGGVRSFLTRYFSSFDGVERDQAEWNEQVRLAFDSLALDLYDLVGLEWSDGQKPFGPEWDELGLSHLPGQLAPELRERLHQAYDQMVSPLYLVIHKYLQKDKERFSQALRPLFGLGHEDLIQLSCFESRKAGHPTDHIDLLGREQWSTFLPELKLLDKKAGLSSFCLEMGPYTMQLRLKPMNAFTNSAYKVNCSYKKEDV